MTKTKRKEACKAILNKYPLNSIINDQSDIDFLLSVFEKHPEWDIKAGIGFESIKIRVANVYKTRCFYIVRKDGSSTDISYIVALDGTGSKISNVKCACRVAVREIVMEFQNKIKFGIDKCPVTGAILSSSNDTHIDHYNLTFDELFYKWIAGKDVDLLFSDLNNGSIDNETEIYFVSESNRSDFINFHNSNTNLRAVSRIANLSLLKSTSKR